MFHCNEYVRSRSSQEIQNACNVCVILPKGKTEMWAGDDDQYTYHEERYVDPHADFFSANE